MKMRKGVVKVLGSVLSFLVLATMVMILPIPVMAAGPAPVPLGASGNFTILAKSGISSTGTTNITGDIGVSPAAAAITGNFALVADVSTQWSTSTLVNGKVYAVSDGEPTPTNLGIAVLAMEAAYTNAATRTAATGAFLNVGGGTLAGQNFAPGLYTWTTPVTITDDINITGSASDVWIFQITGTLDIASGKKVILAGGAQPANIFWQVAGTVSLGTTSQFKGNILAQTNIAMLTGANLTGRALAQTAVTLDANLVKLPGTGPGITGNASLVLLPAAQTVSANGTFNVDIQVQAHGELVVGVQSYLDFDPTYMSVNSITPSMTWGGNVTVLENSSNNTAGKVNFAAGLLGASQNATGNFTIATVNFQAKAGTGNTSITFHFQPDTLIRDTEISDVNSNPVLGAAIGANVEVIIPSGAALGITVALQGTRASTNATILAQQYGIPIMLKLFPPNTNLTSANATTAAWLYTSNATSGRDASTANVTANFTGVPLGTYDITVVSEHTLINIKKNVTISSDMALYMGFLLEGNVDNNGLVNASDFGLLKLSLNKAIGTVGYNPMADFDRNGLVNASDFGLLKLSLNKGSPQAAP